MKEENLSIDWRESVGIHKGTLETRESADRRNFLSLSKRPPEMTFSFVGMVGKGGHPIAERAAKENYVETGAVTLGALYCSVEATTPAGEGKGVLVLLQLTFAPPYRRTLGPGHTDARWREARTGLGRALRWCFGPAK